MSGLPLQHDADMADPREHIAWGLVALPHANKTAPLIVAPDVLADWSEQMYKAGFRHHPELQEIKYIPAPASHNWVMGSAGHWGPVDESIPPEVTAPDTSHLSMQEKAILLERLKEEMESESVPHNFAEVIE